MEIINLAAPKGKWRVIELETGKEHCSFKHLIKDCDSKKEAFALTDEHNLGISPKLAYHVFDCLGHCWRGPGELIPLVPTVFEIEQRAA